MSRIMRFKNPVANRLMAKLIIDDRGVRALENACGPMLNEIIAELKRRGLEIPPADLIDHNPGRPIAQWEYPCIICGENAPVPEPLLFDADHHYCGCSPRCCL